MTTADPGAANSPQPEPHLIRSRDEAESTMAVITALTLQLNAEANEQDKKLAAVRSHDAEIIRLQKRISRYRAGMEQWANENRLAEFGDRSSLEMRHGTLRFKWGNRFIKFLEGWSEELCLAALRRRRKTLGAYIRIREEIDRQKLLADSRPEVGELKPSTLKAIGLEVDREERFYIEPKLESQGHPDKDAGAAAVRAVERTETPNQDDQDEKVAA